MKGTKPERVMGDDPLAPKPYAFVVEGPELRRLFASVQTALPSAQEQGMRPMLDNVHVRRHILKGSHALRMEAADGYRLATGDIPVKEALVTMTHQDTAVLDSSLLRSFLSVCGNADVTITLPYPGTWLWPDPGYWRFQCPRITVDVPTISGPRGVNNPDGYPDVDRITGGLENTGHYIFSFNPKFFADALKDARRKPLGSSPMVHMSVKAAGTARDGVFLWWEDPDTKMVTRHLLMPMEKGGTHIGANVPNFTWEDVEDPGG